MLDEIGAWLLGERDAFASAEIHGHQPGRRYAIAQLRRLQQSARLAAHRDDVLAWLREEPTLDLDQVAARIALRTSRAPGAGDSSHALECKQWVKQLYRSLHDQDSCRSDFAHWSHSPGSALIPSSCRARASAQERVQPCCD
ncbi:MAG: hypothetical protein U0610_01510 [bacterium]